MDNVCSLQRRLIAALLAFVALVSLASTVPAHAQSLPTESYAMSECYAAVQANAGNGVTYTCTADAPPNCVVNMTHPYNGGTYFSGSWEYDCSTYTAPPPSNPCSSIPTVHLYMDGKMLTGTTFTENQQDPSSGTWVACTMAFTPSGAPILDPYSGQWQTYGVAAPSGNPSSTGTPTGAGTGDWVDSNGNPLNPQPSPTTTAPTDNTTPPQTCGGGSCYDPASDQYCSTSGGQQYCVSGATARSSAGGCASGSTSVTCGGSPSAPLPNAPQTGVTNAAQDIHASDSYTQANPTTGSAQQVTVNVYTAPGTTSTSGQKSTDQGPASSSSTSSAGSASGGQDCNSPPVCSGDAATCGVMRQEWYAMCSAKKGTDQLHTDLAGTGTPPSSSTVYSSSQVWVTPTVGNTVGDAANAGNYDESGGGATSQCPLQDFSFTSVTTVVKLSQGCAPLNWIAIALEAFTLFSAAMITAGSNR